MSLAGRVALVTGASRGIGRAIATKLGQQGIRLALVALEAEELERTTSELQQRGMEAFPVQADFSHPDEVQDMAARVLDHFGKVDILINNAGFGRRREHFVKIDLETWQQVIAGNLTASFITCHEVVPGMMSQGWGRIVNISAIQAWRPLQGNAAYAAAKGGLMALTRSLAVDLAPHGVTVNCIAPGPVDTRMRDQDTDGHGGQDWPTLLGRRGSPHEVAALAAFLVSEESSYVVGQVIACDGGRLISRKPEVNPIPAYRPQHRAGTTG